MEIWKRVKGYEGYYEVSNEGRIRSLDRETTFKDGRKRVFYGRILSLNSINNSGYITVGYMIMEVQKHCFYIELLQRHLLIILTNMWK